MAQDYSRFGKFSGFLPSLFNTAGRPLVQITFDSEDRRSIGLGRCEMDPQLLDGYFTNLVLVMEAGRNRMLYGTDREAPDRPRSPRTRILLPWFAALAVVWLGVVTAGFWL
jgi:hypothetical protein